MEHPYRQQFYTVIVLEYLCIGAYFACDDVERHFGEGYRAKMAVQINIFVSKRSITFFTIQSTLIPPTRNKNKMAMAATK